MLHEYTIEDYVDLEARGDTKHEFVDGEIFAMTGGSPTHAALISNVNAQLHLAVAARGCRVFSSDLRIYIPDARAILYPDASVICGKPEMDKRDELAIRNPILVVEVTSPSSAKTDRGKKSDYYKRVPSLEAYLVVSHTQRVIEVHCRNDARKWQPMIKCTRGELDIECLSSSIDVDAIYKGVNIPALPDDDRHSS